MVVCLNCITLPGRSLKEKKLLDSNKQLDQVIYKTTHDLRAPLMSALGLVDLAMHAPADQKDEYLALIRKSLNKLNGFIEEMHHFSGLKKWLCSGNGLTWTN
jgi:Signal transduction histidine kinase